MFFAKKSPSAGQPSSLIVGLGNPGKEYAGHRHNIGFMAVDAIASDYNFSPWKKAKGGMLAEGAIDGRKTFLFKPLSYMNLSGGPAADVARFYKIAPEHIIAIHDELDVAPGKLRVKKGGGHGGHNGLKSLDNTLGKEYWRVRVGIGHPGDKNMVSDYVLSNFAKAEKPVFELMIQEISRHIALLLQGDDAGFMNRVALATKEEK
jgi:PTH1 family peptidyl-tRNA hydrolase